MTTRWLAAHSIRMPRGEWLYTDRFVTALQVAAVMHVARERNGSGVPPLIHLPGAGAIAGYQGAGADEAIAALLHLSLEDVQPTEGARATVAWHRPRALRAVEARTDGDPVLVCCHAQCRHDHGYAVAAGRPGSHPPRLPPAALRQRRRG